MSVELATAYVSIIPSTKGIAGQLREQMAGPIEAEGDAAGGKFGAAMSGMATKALKVGAGAVVAGFGASLVSGFNRLQAIDDARFKLQGLGHDTQTVDAIMENALASVKGTAFGLGDAATIAAGAVAAGIPPGEALERTLGLTGDAATIAGTSLDEMGEIFNKVAASNRLSMREVNQLALRGVPIMQWLAEEYGVTAAEAQDMVSRGEVDFATFQNVIEENIGGAALTAGESFRGAFANMGAAIGRFGAALLGPAFAAAPNIFGNITDAVDRATNVVGPLAEQFAVRLPAAISTVRGWFDGFVSTLQTGTQWAREHSTALTVVGAVLSTAIIPTLVSATVAFAQTVAGWVASAAAATVSAARQAAAWLLIRANQIAGIAILGVVNALTVASWVQMAAVSMKNAIRMAASWVIAMGPVGWVIATVVALVALIIANWDKVVEWTRKAWTWVTDTIGKAWTWVRDTTQAAVRAVVDFFGNLRDRVTDLAGRMRDAVVSAVSNLRDRTVGFFTGLRDSAVSLVGNLRDRVVGFFGNLRDQTVAAVSNARDRAVSAFTGLRDRAVAAVSDLLSSVRDRFTSIVTAVTDAAGRARQAVVDGFQRLRDGVVDRATSLVTWLQGLPGRILSALGNPARMLYDAGRAILRGLADGIKSMASAPVDAVRGVATRIKNMLPGSPVKEGPLRTLNRGHAGGEIVRMVASGITGNVGVLSAAAEEMARAALFDVGTAGVPALSSMRPASAVRAAPVGRSASSGSSVDDRELLGRIARAVERAYIVDADTAEKARLVLSR